VLGVTRGVESSSFVTLLPEIGSSATLRPSIENLP